MCLRLHLLSLTFQDTFNKYWLQGYHVILGHLLWSHQPTWETEHQSTLTGWELIVTGSTPDALNSISQAQVAQLVTPHAPRESPHSPPLPLFLPLPGQFKHKKKKKKEKKMVSFYGLV